MKTCFNRRTLRPLRLSLLVGAWALWLLYSGATASDVFKPDTPLGLPADTWAFYVPKNNPLTPAKVELGKRLFFEARLSVDGKVSCSTCHDPDRAFTDGKQVAEGVRGQRGTRNSPTLFNVIFNMGQFWDGRVDSLEDQATLPLINPVEMGNPSVEDVVKRLSSSPEYNLGFERAFGGPVTQARLALALASFERTLVSGDSPVDRYMAGDQRALTDDARRGLTIFRGKGRCGRCHTFSEQAPFFTDFAYHNTGVAANNPAFAELARKAFEVSDRPGAESVIDGLGHEPGGQELGRVLVTHHPFDIGSYKTPSLRNIALTAPYFHDGSARTLADVVKFYNGGGQANINRDGELDPLSLTTEEQRQLVTFLEALSGETRNH
jgi:cytochrome c peroxidase